MHSAIPRQDLLLQEQQQQPIMGDSLKLERMRMRHCLYFLEDEQNME